VAIISLRRGEFIEQDFLDSFSWFGCLAFHALLTSSGCCTQRAGFFGADALKMSLRNIKTFLLKDRARFGGFRGVTLAAAIY
jgi:hypothetical protein